MSKVTFSRRVSRYIMMGHPTEITGIVEVTLGSGIRFDRGKQA